MFKRIVGYENYLINEKGTVVSPNGKVLSQRKNNMGYYMVHMIKDGKKTKELVHRLVAFTFVHNEKPEEYIVVNHKDEDPSNNNAWNLEWCTIRYNSCYGNSLKIKKEKEIKKYPLENYAKIPHQRGCFQRACKRRGLNFEDFTEIKAGIYKKPNGKNQSLYVYIPKGGDTHFH